MIGKAYLIHEFFRNKGIYFDPVFNFKTRNFFQKQAIHKNMTNPVSFLFDLGTQFLSSFAFSTLGQLGFSSEGSDKKSGDHFFSRALLELPMDVLSAFSPVTMAGKLFVSTFQAGFITRAEIRNEDQLENVVHAFGRNLLLEFGALFLFGVGMAHAGSKVGELRKRYRHEVFKGMLARMELSQQRIQVTQEVLEGYLRKNSQFVEDGVRQIEQMELREHTDHLLLGQSLSAMVDRHLPSGPVTEIFPGFAIDTVPRALDGLDRPLRLIDRPSGSFQHIVELAAENLDGQGRVSYGFHDFSQSGLFRDPDPVIVLTHAYSLLDLNSNGLRQEGMIGNVSLTGVLTALSVHPRRLLNFKTFPPQSFLNPNYARDSMGRLLNAHVQNAGRGWRIDHVEASFSPVFPGAIDTYAVLKRG